MARFAVVLCATAISLFAAPAVARADGVIIDPVRVTLPVDRVAGSFVVTNGTDRPILFQTSLRSWTQVNGLDRLTPTSGIFAVPVVFELAPGGSQTVRVAMQQAPDRSIEETFRILVTELPSGDARRNATNVLLRFSIPIFATPPRPLGSSVAWTCVLQRDGKLRVRAVNHGDEHANIATVRLFADARRRALVSSWSPGAYLLAGQSRTWTVPANVPAGAALLFVESRSVEGEQDAVAAVSGR